MDAVGTTPFGYLNNFISLQVTLRRRGWADDVRLLRHPNVGRHPVGFRADGDCLIAQFLARPNDPHGNFTAIGYKYFLQHNFILNN
jgi:hypothetical protein